MTKASIHYSPLTERVMLGRVNPSTGVAIGEMRDVTSAFLQVMEMKFPINSTQVVNVDGEPSYRVIVVDMEKRVEINDKVYQEGAQ